MIPTPFELLATPFVVRLLAVSSTMPFTALVGFIVIEAGIIELIRTHQVTTTLLAVYVTSAAIGAMRNPSDGFYNWFFRFVTMLANIPRDVVSKPISKCVEE